MNLAYEVRVAQLLLPTGSGGQLTAGNSTTPSTNWDQDTATVEADIKTARLGVYDAIGMTPNTIVIPFKVAYAMALQEDIRAILAAQISGGERLPPARRPRPAGLHPRHARDHPEGPEDLRDRGRLLGHADRDLGRRRPAALRQPGRVATAVNIGTASGGIVIAPFNRGRNALTIVNTSATTMFAAYGVPAALTTGVPIFAAQTLYEPDFTGTVSLIAAGATALAYVTDVGAA
jgi:hypothetical protein